MLTFFSKKDSNFSINAAMVQSAARKCHNLKIASSGLTGRKLYNFNSNTHKIKHYQLRIITKGFQFLITSTHYGEIKIAWRTR